MAAELEKVNWNLVQHYVLQAERALTAMEAAYCEEAKESLLKTAVRYMLAAMQQIEHLMSGHARIDLWAAFAAAGCMPGWASRLNVLMNLVQA